MIEKRKIMMNEYLVKSKALPYLFVKKMLPTSYKMTPVQWGSRDDAKLLSYDRATSLQEELALNGIETELIQNGDLSHGRSGIKLQ